MDCFWHIMRNRKYRIVQPGEVKEKRSPSGRRICWLRQTLLNLLRATKWSRQRLLWSPTSSEDKEEVSVHRYLGVTRTPGWEPLLLTKFMRAPAHVSLVTADRSTQARELWRRSYLTLISVVVSCFSVFYCTLWKELLACYRYRLQFKVDYRLVAVYRRTVLLVFLFVETV